jgi:hypothetical protein
MVWDAENTEKNYQDAQEDKNMGTSSFSLGRTHSIGKECIEPLVLAKRANPFEQAACNMRA